MNPAGRSRWVSVWGASFQGRNDAPVDLSGRTFRYPLRSSAGGLALRLRFSNELETEPLVIGAASVARSVSADSPNTGVPLALSFGGAAWGRAPPGAPLLSDPLPFSIAALEEIAVSVYFPERYLPKNHASIKQEQGGLGWLSERGDHSERAEFSGTPAENALIAGFELQRTEAVPGVVVLGDTRSPGPNSWVDRLVRRAAGRLAIANRSQVAGALYIGLPGESGLARFDRDVLSSPGVTHVVIESGNNDLIVAGRQNQWDKTAGGRYNLATVGNVDLIIRGFRQQLERARAHDIKVIGTTIAPFEGANYWSPERMQGRARINEWIRNGGEYDGFIDFDAILRDPERPTRLRPSFDSGNHREPSAAGHQAIADAIDFRLFA